MTAISQNDDNFVKVMADFYSARAEESVARARSQRAGNLTKHASGTVDEREGEEIEDNAEGKCSHPSRYCVEQATGEVDTIFRGGDVWGNNSVLLSALHTLGVLGGDGVMMTQ